KSTTSIDFTTSGGSLKPAGGTNASPMPMFPIGNFQGVSIKGTIVSDVTSWIDAGVHRVVKTHESSSTDVAMTETLIGGAQPGPSLTSTFSVKGAETIDLTPA
ncbi:MAG TPA: hypothetical protein VLU92_01090, partial [Candidatus Dormibacteraeota bacterium]|nr:hypothetical protein [Candidatus Dormibacteraeota bacterium]